jgi:hypothetical protein
MIRWWAAVLAVVAAGCLSVQDGFVCAADVDCTNNGIQGTCEPSHRCSFPDDSCGSGKRFGPYSGTELANSCVIADLTDPPDLGEDGPAPEWSYDLLGNASGDLANSGDAGGMTPTDGGTPPDMTPTCGHFMEPCCSGSSKCTGGLLCTLGTCLL